MALDQKQTVEQLVCLSCRGSFSAELKFCPSDRTLLIRPQGDPNLGTILSGLYEISSVLGRGGTSVVYKARHQLMDRLVAIKMLLWSGDALHDDKKIRRFQQEARTASRLNHPNIATLYDFGVTPQGQPFLVMEYLEGKSLEELIHTEYLISPERAVHMVCQICEGMEHAHHKGIVHRDLKPSNVIVSKTEKAGEVVKIVDFGIAELLPSERGDTLKFATSNHVFGSPLYMSPEQFLEKNVDSRSDIYSLGVTLFQALTGTVPFAGETLLEVAKKQVSHEPPSFESASPEAKVPKALEATVMQCLEKEATNRPQSMLRLKELLLRATNNGAKERESRFIRLSRVLIADNDDQTADVLKQALDKFEDVCVIGVTKSGSEALSQTLSMKPDIILMDVKMPDMDGCDAARSIKQKLPKSHIIMMSSLEEEKDILSALRAGAEGFMLKRFDNNNLRLALRAVGEGTVWLDPDIDSNVLDIYRQSAPDLVGHPLQGPRRQDRPDDISFVMSLAQSFTTEKKFEEAETLYRVALAFLERTRKDSHPAVFKAALKLADTYFAQQKMSQAEPLYFQAIEIQTKVLGPEHPNIATTLEKVGALHYAQQDYAQAERFYYWALSIREKSAPEDHAKIAATCDKLASVYRKQQKFGQAEQYSMLADRKRFEEQAKTLDESLLSSS